MADARDTELRERVRAILAANRELGSRYEDAAVDQIVDLLQGRPPKRVQPGAPPPPLAAPVPVRSGGWHPLAVIAAIAAAVIVGLPLLRLAVGMLAGVVDAFVWVIFAFACVYLVKLFRRMSRGLDRPRHYGDAWEDERGHRWRRVY